MSIPSRPLPTWSWCRTRNRTDCSASSGGPHRFNQNRTETFTTRYFDREGFRERILLRVATLRE